MKQLYRRARLCVAGAPLLLPLAAVAGCLLGGWAGCLPALAAALMLRTWRVLVCAVLAAAVSLLHTGLLEQRSAELQQALAEQGCTVVCGTVERTMKRSCVLREGLNGIRVSVAGDAVADARVGERLRVTAEALSDTPPPFPGMFDAAAWRRSQGIAASLGVLRAERMGCPLSLDTLRAWGLEQRARMVRLLMPAGTESDARRQVLCAMVLGAKDEADAETLGTFRRGGCMHAFAVSGLHVGFVAGFLWGLLLLLRVRPAAARVLLLAAVGLYVLVTGAAVPALRAYLMLAVGVGAVLLRRRVRMLNTWCFAALLTLLISPHQLGNAGFLLSFAVYASICVGWAFCLRRDRPWFGPDSYVPFTLRTPWENHLQKAELMVRGAVVVALCAWLTALPITLYFFHTVNPYSFLTNAAAAVLLFPVMVAGMLYLALGSIPCIGAWVGGCALQLTGALLAVVSFFGSGPGAYLPAVAPQPPPVLMVLPVDGSTCCCVLGNPGLAVEPGNGSTARFTTAPALFHGGFRPAAVLPLRTTPAATEGAQAVVQEQAGARLLTVAEKPQSFRTAAGTYTVYPPAAELPTRTAANRCPVIVWDSPAARVLYVGAASRATWETLPESERHADVLILGANPALPLWNAESWAEAGVRTLILLPEAADAPLERSLFRKVYTLRNGDAPLLLTL